MRISLTFCGFHLHVADSAYSCGTSISSIYIYKYRIICFVIPQTVLDSTITVADSAKLPLYERYSVLGISFWNPKQRRRSKKTNKVADSATNLIMVCCGIRLQCTECKIWPRNVSQIRLENNQLDFVKHKSRNKF